MTFRPVAGAAIHLLVAALRDALPGEGVLAASWDALAANALIVDAVPGLVPQQPVGDPRGAWWLILDGEFSQGADCTAAGSFESVRLGAGQWLDMTSCLLPSQSGAGTVRCHRAGRVAALPLRELLAVAAQDPAVLRALLTAMAERLREQSERLDEVAACDVPVRVARWLLRQLPRDASTAQQLHMSQRKQDLARQLCTTSETLSRTLKRLCESGLIQMRGYELTVLDPQALRELASRPAYGVGAERVSAGR